MITFILALALAHGSASAAPAAKKSVPAARAETAARDTAGRRHLPRPARADTALVTLGTQDGAPRAFVAFPPGATTAPGIVVAHEWWGLNGQIRDVARRLAQQGYIAIVPDLYHGKVAGDADDAHILMRGLDPAEAQTTLAAAAAWLVAEPRTKGRKRGVLGFCMGGGLALQDALADPTLGAAVMFYGVPESRADRIATLHVPLLGHFGAEDQGIEVARVEAFERVLKAAKKDVEIEVYSGAGHAFMNEEQASYRPEAARLAWARTLDFLQKRLKTQP